MKHFTAVGLGLLLLSCGKPDSQFTEFKPDIVVAPEEVDFGQIVKLYSLSIDIQILNTGQGPLNVTSVRLENSSDDDGTVFAVETEPGEINGGDSLPVTIRFSPAEYLDYRADLIIESDDEDESVITIPVLGSGIIGSTPDIETSSPSVNFGEVAGGSKGTGYFTILNVGNGPLEILDTAIEQDGDVFSMVTDPKDQQIAAGSEYTVIIDYTPTGDGSGDSGSFVITSTDPDEREVEVVLLGGDGGTYQVPEAVIDCASLQSITPPTTVVLDGRASTDPEDLEEEHPLTFSWTLLESPELSRTEIEHPAEDAPELFIDVAGDYNIELMVTDFNGVQSLPTTCDFQVIPDEELYVALSWNTGNSDLDLHLVPAGNSMWGCNDCFFCNPAPPWSVHGWGIPVYALDNTYGYGPENINVKFPGDLRYYVRVHYYADHGGGSTKATISIYIDGELEVTLTEDMNQAERWKAGYVEFDATGVGHWVEEGTVEHYGARRCPSC